MPDLFEQNELWVGDDDNIQDANDIVLPEISDEDLSDHDDLFETSFEHEFESPQQKLDDNKIEVVEDVSPEEQPEEVSMIEEKVPGSDMVLVEEDDDDDQPVKETDWANDGDHTKFIAHLMDRKNHIPRHSGDNIPGCERAKSYLKSLDNEISKAMRTDLEGKIDEHQVDAIRKEIEKDIERLDMQINKLKRKTKKVAEPTVHLVSEGKCENCNSLAPMWDDLENNKKICMHCNAEVGSEKEDTIEKMASTPVINVYVTAFERAVVGTIINSSVSGGRNIEETYEKLKNKYNFTPREELAIQQLVSDYGFPLFKDRGLLNESADPASGNNVEWQTNYNA